VTDPLHIACPEELAACLAAADAPIEIIGRGSKRGIGRPVTARQIIALDRYSGVTAHEPAELVIDAKTGTPMGEIEAALAAGRQMLAFEPPDLGALLGTGVGTVGGAIACNLAGPRRIKAGAARDHLLGVTAVSGRGEVFKAGGRVVKNVTGYDLCKLLAGSYGTLAVMTDITLKVLPAPEKTHTALVFGLDPAEAWDAMTRALASPLDVSGAAYVPREIARRFSVPYLEDAPVTALRLEGTARSVADRCPAMRALLGGGRTEELHTLNSHALWHKIRDVTAFAGDPRTVWRVSVPPQGGLTIAAAVTRIDGASAYFDWGGGLAWIAVPDTGEAHAAVIRAAVAEAGGGHATLIRASLATRAAVACFQPQAEAVTALSARIKQAFDPKGILNPGRMG
jgi:glycolate oxidase FAD binding subunit